jgi:hypothetical protein
MHGEMQSRTVRFLVAMQVLAIIPGPKCPKMLSGIMQGTWEAFAALGKSGLRVRCCTSDGRLASHDMRPVLSGILADTQVWPQALRPVCSVL